nr:ATP-binding protein [Paenibacillus soyae]
MHEKLHVYAGQLEEQNTKLKELDELKDEFLANTSHEIRTPLQGIVGISESLLEEAAGPLPPAVRSNLQLIADSGSRLTGLVNDILDMSKLKHGDLQLRRSPVHLRQAASVVLAVFEPLARQKSILLINDIEQHVPLAYADENRLQQILYNVIGNAYKFTDRGEVRIRAEEENGFLVVEVRDTGIGIDRADQEAVLEPFTQAGAYRPNGGTGLGLPITRKLVELHGGELKLVSLPGAGTSVTFSLPVAADSDSLGYSAAGGEGDMEASLRKYEPPIALAEDLPAPAAASRSGGAQATILIVDDEPINLQVWKNYLADTGHLVLSAGSGQEALNAVREQKPDLVLLDIMMPGMTGYEVCSALRKQYHPGELPIVLLTAKNQPSDILQGFDAGANDYMIKPVSKRELLARMQLHLELARLNQALEEQVKQRTADLENTYRQLQDSMMETYDALGEVAIWEERNRIAHEIHDILGHKLTGAAMQLEAAKRLMLIDPDSAQSKLDAALESVRKGLEDVRVAVRMMKENSPKDDLAESLNELMNETEHMTGITVRRSISGDIPVLDALMKKSVFHALQEGLTNGIKHGGSKQFDFALYMDEDVLLFALHNDGLPYTAAPYGFGLSAMKDKIKHLGGTIELAVSDILGGSVLRIEIPMRDI